MMYRENQSLSDAVGSFAGTREYVDFPSFSECMCPNTDKKKVVQPFKSLEGSIAG